MAKRKSEPTSPLHPSRNDLPREVRETVVAILNQQLADTVDLASQTKQAHWNVRGAHFIALHELFDKLHEELEENVDEIAERCTALGGTALGTARIAAATSVLDEYPLEAIQGHEHVVALSDRFAALAKSTRQAIAATAEAGDADSSDLFTGVSRSLDKALWFLEAHLED